MEPDEKITSIIPYAEELIKLENQSLSVYINDLRGGDVLSLVHKKTGRDVLWRSRRARSERPRAGSLGPTDTDFYDEYPGGIQELFPNTANTTVINGVEYPFHGEACRITWGLIPNNPDAGTQADALRVTLQAFLRRAPVKMIRTISLDPDREVLSIESSVENLSDTRTPYSWAFHPVFGENLISEDCTLYLPTDMVTAHPEEFSVNQKWPPGSTQALLMHQDVGALVLRGSRDIGADLLYAECPSAWFVLRNETTGLTVSASWDSDVMPYLWIWQECHDPKGFPWWGLEHVVGIEPHSSVPAQELKTLTETGQSSWLGPKERITATLRLCVNETDTSEIPTGVDASGLPMTEGK